MIEGVSQVIVEVDDQDRASRFWTERIGVRAPSRTAPYGEAGALDRGAGRGTRRQVLVLSLRRGDPSDARSEELPTSNVFFYCDDLPHTYDELRARGVEFPQPPVEQSCGWWSMLP